MKFGQLMADILVYVSLNFEMYIFDIAQVIGENVPIAFLYVLSIVCKKQLFLWRSSYSFQTSKESYTWYNMNILLHLSFNYPY